VFRVEFSGRAQRDIGAIFEYIRHDSPIAAIRWREKLLQKLRSLSTMPEACGYAPESNLTGAEVRQLLFGRYRILFTIQSERVLIVTVRHGARRLLRPDDLNDVD